MEDFSPTTKTRGLVLSLVFLGFLAFIVFQPFLFRSQAVDSKDKSNAARRKSVFENYDIRTDKAEAENLSNFREKAGKNAADFANAAEKLVFAENALRSKVPTLKIEYSQDIRKPETIAPDARQGRAFLTAPSKAKRRDVLRAFVKQNKNLFGVTDRQADELKLAAEYTNPDGKLSFVQYEQKINEIPVFRGELKAGFSKNGEIIRVINNLAPDLIYENLSTDFGNPVEALKSAARYIDYDLEIDEQSINEKASDDLKTIFGASDWANKAEKMYFPLESGVARPAWRVLIWKPESAYYVVVDAETGQMLWRKNITEEQTQPATFSVYANPNAMINVADSPFPMTPGATDPNLNVQGAMLSRSIVTRVGNEAPYSFNNNGWISDGGNETEGNAVDAGIDRDGTDGIDQNGRATGSPFRSFIFNYSPGDPNTDSGDAPYPAPQTYPVSEFQKGAVTQLFYISNRFHDELYRLGFNEQAYNFQKSNFERGGAENDRVSAEAQDSGGTNNANFSAPADGTPGKMQMFLWNGPEPDFDGGLDADIVIHELTHGLSSRLHGNSTGLTTNMARSMGEGWSDFYAHALLSESSDPIEGIYTIGGYATYLRNGIRNGNYYYGIRRFPKAVMSFTGANGKPHNPLTFRHLNSNCNAEIGTSSQIGSISAFPRNISGSTFCDQVHAAGEIWSSALWEVRARFVSRLGWETGNRRILQIVTDAMKLSPLNPTFLQGRDAILAAAQAAGSDEDVADVWEGFRIRGMGFSAEIISIGSGANNVNVVEAFDAPNLIQSPAILIDDSTGNNNGFAEPGEPVILNIPVTNKTGKTAYSTFVRVGRSRSTRYGNILNNQTVYRRIRQSMPSSVACGDSISLRVVINSSFGSKSDASRIIFGQPLENAGFSQNFDGVTAPSIPTGWNAPPPNPNIANAAAWQTVAAGAGNAVFAPAPNKAFLAQLESPLIPVTVGAAKLKFRINYNTESGWDGVTLDMKIGDGAFQDIIAAGGIFVSGEYSNFLSAGTFPNAGRRAWTGNSNGYVDVEITLPPSAKNQNVQFRWNASSDTAIAGVGTYIDDVRLISEYSCAPVGF